jgi:hypothetical protein
MRNSAEPAATLVHGTFAYIALLAVQVPLTIILSITKHKAAAVAGSLLIYAVIWPFVKCTCGVVVEVIAIGFGFVTCIVQLTDVLDKRITTVNMILALLAFFACAASLVMLIPCTAALSTCHRQRAVRDAYVAEMMAVRRFVPPPTPTRRLAQACLTPPPQAMTRSDHWITVLSPDNKIDIAKRVRQS